MKQTTLLLLAGLFAALATSAKNNDKKDTVAACSSCIVAAEQSQHRIIIADTRTGAIVWEWKPEHSNVRPSDVKWFSNPSEAKMVYDRKYVLMTASGGGVALIRVADRKTVFYAYAGGNTHSAELLPDGNIVSASSTGNFLTVFRTDTTHFPENVYAKKIWAHFAHNVVWDAAGKKLYSAAMDSMLVFSYNNNCEAPDLQLETRVKLPGTEAHDLYPVYGKRLLWLSNLTNVWYFDLKTLKTLPARNIIQQNVKSVSSGPGGLPTICALPKESWWTDEVIDANGHTVFLQKGLKIYKARWVLPDLFSNPDKKDFRYCKK